MLIVLHPRSDITLLNRIKDKIKEMDTKIDKNYKLYEGKIDDLLDSDSEHNKGNMYLAM